MKLKKTFSFTDKNQIWRLLISDSDKLIIETRDTDRKQVFFNSIDLNIYKKELRNFQLDEKFWTGIEAVYKNIIYFHEYAKPNMPEHKKIIAFDLDKKIKLWQNDDLTFLSLFDDKLYAVKKKFEGQQLFLLNYLTGEIIEDLGNDAEVLNQILSETQSSEKSNS